MYFMEEFCVPKEQEEMAENGEGASVVTSPLRDASSPSRCPLHLPSCLLSCYSRSHSLCRDELLVDSTLPRHDFLDLYWALLDSISSLWALFVKRQQKSHASLGPFPPFFLFYVVWFILPHILVSSRSLLLSYFSPLTMLIIVHTYYPFITLVEILVTEVICLGIAGSVCTLFHLKNSAHLLTIHQFPI